MSFDCQLSVEFRKPAIAMVDGVAWQRNAMIEVICERCRRAPGGLGRFPANGVVKVGGQVVRLVRFVEFLMTPCP